jgi:hypothetical protein
MRGLNLARAFSSGFCYNGVYAERKVQNNTFGIFNFNKG